MPKCCSLTGITEPHHSIPGSAMVISRIYPERFKLPCLVLYNVHRTDHLSGFSNLLSMSECTFETHLLVKHSIKAWGMNSSLGYCFSRSFWLMEILNSRLRFFFFRVSWFLLKQLHSSCRLLSMVFFFLLCIPIAISVHMFSKCDNACLLLGK